MSLLAKACARARESLSAQLDGELPELDLDRLEAHLLVCPECSAWAEEVRDLTARLRATTLEQPTERLALPRRRNRSRRASAGVAVASAAAVVATMFFASGRQNASPGSLVTGAPRTDPTYDVAAGVVYPPHPVLGTMILGVSESLGAGGPVRVL